MRSSQLALIVRLVQGLICGSSIVAVHGLNPFGDKNHPENTWTADGNLWLRDFLPATLPKARVMLFGYNANVAFNPVDLRVRDHAMKLLEFLHLKRGVRIAQLKIVAMLTGDYRKRLIDPSFLSVTASVV